ncbi:uncharacterized protein LOC142590416 [Dermacentor variabilis]|uniref:uncharacterized protein LOC142590416 n=1 Tax=Dermacentor variabilis TaxID=34621 RepID=UPI003F5B7F43
MTDSCTPGCGPHRAAAILKLDDKPNCKMSMGFTPVGGRCSQYKSYFSSGSSATAITHRLMHWVIYCEFDDGKSFEIEALEVQGNLTPYMRPVARVKLPRDKVCLGVHKRSFEDVSNAFHALSVIEKYHVVENNCQTWVVALLEQLKLPLPEEVSTIAKTIEKIFSDNGKGKGYDFVVHKVRSSYECLMSHREGSAPEEMKEDNTSVEDENRNNESRICLLDLAPPEER